MNNYEGIFIVKPDLKEEEAAACFKTINDITLKNGGSVKKEEPWGKRSLAYKLKKAKEGYYYKLDFAAPPDAIEKIEAACKLNADILRTMITKR